MAVSPPKEDVLDVFFERATPDVLRAYNNNIRRKLAQGRNVYRFDSGPFYVPATKHRIKGDRPPCGGGQQKIDDEIKDIINALKVAAAAGDAYFATGGLLSFFAYKIGEFIFNSNVYQTDANCSVICALVPGKIELTPDGKGIVGATIKTFFQDKPDASWVIRQPNDDYWDNWAQVRELTIVPEALEVEFQDLLYDDPEERNRQCKISLVCVLLKNWSNVRQRGLRIQVDFDADAVEQQRICTDFTVINREHYLNEMYLLAEGEYNALDYYIEELKKQKTGEEDPPSAPPG